MKTIKLPYNTSEDLTPILKQYSNIVRYSYNRFFESKSEKDIRDLTKSLKSIDLLNTWLLQCGIRDGKALHKRFKNKKVIFGGKINLLNRLKNKISKDSFNINRLCPLTIQGEELKQGNRSFKLDIINNNQIIFKLNKHKHIKLELPKLRNNIKKELFKLQSLNDINQRQKGYTYSIKFDLKYIYISFEEFKEDIIELNSNRYIGIDLNPDTIGISILDNDKIIHAQEFSFKPIFNKILDNNLSSNSTKMIYYQNKLKYETFEISKVISLLAKQFKCKSVFIEDLNFKGSTKVKISNRKINNLWKRNLFINNLKKRLNIFDINLYEVNTVYSSFIGNLMYNYTDAVNASIEIARRGFEYRIKKNNKGFYPNILVKHQWKEMAAKYNDWKKLFIEVKNSKLKYRVSLNECLYKFNVLKQNSTYKSMILYYVFYD